MSTLIVEGTLADRLQAIANQEHRSVEAVLETMLTIYATPLTNEEINRRLAATGEFILPIDDGTPPPMSEEELQRLADEVGRTIHLSSIIIEERRITP